MQIWLIGQYNGPPLFIKTADDCNNSKWYKRLSLSKQWSIWDLNRTNFLEGRFEAFNKKSCRNRLSLTLKQWVFLLLQQVQAESTDKIKERANLVRSMLAAKGRPSLAPVHWNGLDLVSWPFHALHVDTFNKSLSLRALEIVSWRQAFLWMMIEWS